MDLQALVRRFSRTGNDLGLEHPPTATSTSPSSTTSPTSFRNHQLRVDTTVLKKDFKSKMNTFDTSSFYEQQPQDQDDRRAATPTGALQKPPQRTFISNNASEPQGEEVRTLRRQRSNSECLFLAKQNGGQDLPGPCKEYITNVKQILARSEDLHAKRDGNNGNQRRRSMSMRNHSPVFKEAAMMG